MMNSTIHLLDVVALAENLPEQGLPRGQVGMGYLSHRTFFFIIGTSYHFGLDESYQ
jgi:hypothetical protein